MIRAIPPHNLRLHCVHRDTFNFIYQTHEMPKSNFAPIRKYRILSNQFSFQIPTHITSGRHNRIQKEEGLELIFFIYAIRIGYSHVHKRKQMAAKRRTPTWQAQHEQYTDEIVQYIYAAVCVGLEGDRRLHLCSVRCYCP